MKARCMIAEDSQYMRDILDDEITSAGHLVVATAKNGLEAVRIYKDMLEDDEAPDIVFLDINMAKMDGMEALEQIMELDPKAIVIMCTSINSSDKVMEAVSMGAKEYFIKPPKREKIKKEINKVMKNKK